jgi:transposase InsO family protein
MWAMNPTWGSPRIRDELKKLGLQASTATIRKYRPRSRHRSAQGWWTFLRNHTGAIAAMDFFVVPTVTFRLLYVLVVLRHERRMIVHFNITEMPTAAWTAQQVINAFPDDTAPKYLVRDRDSIYGSAFFRRVDGMGIQQKLIAPRCPWQSPYVERLIGSIRRECLDRIIVLNDGQLRRHLEQYIDYYHTLRPHRGLEHDSPVPRRTQSTQEGKVIAIPLLGGLHHHYLRRAA